MDIGLRNALIAKTALRDSSVTNLGLVITSTEEAYLELNRGNNVGHKNPIVVFDRSKKIYKNLLKQYTTKQLIKFFTSYYTTLRYKRKYGKEMTPASPKKQIIEIIIEAHSPNIKKVLKSKHYENSYT